MEDEAKGDEYLRNQIREQTPSEVQNKETQPSRQDHEAIHEVPEKRFREFKVQNQNHESYQRSLPPNTNSRKRHAPMVTFLPAITHKPIGERFSLANVGAPNDPVIDIGDKHPFGAGKTSCGFIDSRRNSEFRNQIPSCFVSLNNYGYEPRLPGPILKLNISGTRFLVKMDTLRKDPMVYEKILEDAEWLADSDEYYFERDPVVFRFVHAYLRYEEMHLPLNICGPLLEKELEAWGLQLGFDVQRCCLGPVMDSKSKLDSLKKFEEAFTEPTSYTRNICT